MFLTSWPADFCLTSTGPTLLSAWFFPVPEPSCRAQVHLCRCSCTTHWDTEQPPAAVEVLSSWAPHLEGDRTDAGMRDALTLVLRGFLPTEHIGTGVSDVLQSSTGNFSKLWHALYPASAAVCWPVKPASQVKKEAEQETVSKARPATAPRSPIPLSPTDLATLTLCGEMHLLSHCSF